MILNHPIKFFLDSDLICHYATEKILIPKRKFKSLEFFLVDKGKDFSLFLQNLENYFFVFEISFQLFYFFERFLIFVYFRPICFFFFFFFFLINYFCFFLFNFFVLFCISNFFSLLPYQIFLFFILCLNIFLFYFNIF